MRARQPWGVARESTAGSPFWVVERYDWSDPSLPVDGGGTRIEAQWTNGGATRMRDMVLLWLLHRGPMYRVIAHMWRKTVDEHARG